MLESKKKLWKNTVSKMNNDPVFPVKTKSGRTVKFTEKMAQYMSDKAKNVERVEQWINLP